MVIARRRDPAVSLPAWRKYSRPAWKLPVYKKKLDKGKGLFRRFGSSGHVDLWFKAGYNGRKNNGAERHVLLSSVSPKKLVLDARRRIQFMVSISKINHRSIALYRHYR